MKRAVIYARYSSDRQSEQSIEGQVHVCTDFAKNNDYVIVGTYIDRAMTGTNDNRAEFQQMIKDSAKNKFEYILVYKLDRFSRNRYDSVMNKSILKKNGVKLVSATEPISEKPEGIILESLLEGMAEYYSVELSQKVKRGMKESRSKGLFTGGNRMYGYNIINQRYVINEEEEASIIRRIYREYTSGIRIKEIVNSLNNEGIRTLLGKKMTPGRVSYILHNPKYMGKCVIAGVEYPNMVPPIIDEETFNYAQHKIARNKLKNGRCKAVKPYLLSGKLYCANCNSLLTGSGGTDKYKRVHYYYKCANKTKNTLNCSSHSYRKDELEDFILNCILNKIMTPSLINEIAENTVSLYNKEIKESLDLKLLKDKLNDIDNKLNNYALAIGQGIFNSKTQEIMNDLLKDKENIETEIAIQESLQTKPITSDSVKEYLNKFNELDYTKETTKKMIFDIFINKIIVYDNDDMVIICNTNNSQIDIKKEPLNQEFIFHSFGGVEGT